MNDENKDGSVTIRSRQSVPLAVPTADGDYLTDEWLDALRAHEFDPEGARLFMIETFPAACELMSYCSIDIEDRTARHSDGPAKRVNFSTGGWSGAEELIGAMLQHFWLRHFHTKWECGGHYEFEVPAEPSLPASVRRRPA